MVWGPIIGAAASYLIPRALDAVFSRGQGPGGTMPWEQAMEQAQAALDPQFQRHLDTTLANVDRQSAARGFYGQMPTDAFRRETAQDLSMQHQGNVAQYANQLQMQQAQLALQQAGQKGAAYQGIGQFAGQAIPYLYDQHQQGNLSMPSWWPFGGGSSTPQHTYQPSSPALEALGTTGPYSGGAAGTLLRGSPARAPQTTGSYRLPY